MDWNGAIELKIGSAQGLNLKKQGASVRETSEFRKFHKKRMGHRYFQPSHLSVQPDPDRNQMNLILWQAKLFGKTNYVFFLDLIFPPSFCTSSDN